MTTLFAWRYFRSKKSANAINIISWISVVAIGVVAAALVVVLSVFNGFEDLVKDLYGDFYADIKVSSTRGKWFNLSEAQREAIEGAGEGVIAIPIIEERAIIIDQEDKCIVWLKGVPSSYGSYAGIPKYIIRGTYTTGDSSQPGLVMGAGVESALQILSDRTIFPLTVYLPNRKATSLSDPMDALHSANVAAAGTFAIQQEFDNQYAFTDVSFMQYMLDLSPSEYSDIEVYLPTAERVDDIAEAIQTALGGDFTIKTRYQQNQALFSAMRAERFIIYGVAILIFLIAAFNIISSLTMTVLEKQEDIAVLNALGTNGRHISLIFLKLGIILAGIGGLAGCLLGWLICLGQQQFHWVKLGGQSFIIDHYPVAMRWNDFALVALLVLIISFISGWIPSRRASRTAYSLKS